MTPQKSFSDLEKDFENILFHLTLPLDQRRRRTPLRKLRILIDEADEILLGQTKLHAGLRAGKPGRYAAARRWTWIVERTKATPCQEILWDERPLGLTRACASVTAIRRRLV